MSRLPIGKNPRLKHRTNTKDGRVCDATGLPIPKGTKYWTWYQKDKQWASLDKPWEAEWQKDVLPLL